MIKFTNIQKRRATLRLLYSIQSRRYQNLLIRFKNTNLCLINELIDKTIFRKNDLFADAATLYEIMQPVGGRGKKHNYHGLSPENIIEAMKNIDRPLCILDEGEEKYAIVIPTRDEKGKPLLVVLQTGCKIDDENYSNINKLVTIFPKEKVHKYLRSFSIEDILYLDRIKLDKIK